MSESYVELLEDWHDRADLATKAFNRSANRCSRWHVILGLIVAALSAVVGTTTFSQLDRSGATSAEVQILLGVLSVTAVVLVGIQTFAGLPDRAVAYRDAGRRFASVRRKIQEILTAAAEGTTLDQPQIESIRAQMDEASSLSPNAPHVIWERMQRRQQGNLTRSERLIRWARGLR